MTLVAALLTLLLTGHTSPRAEEVIRLRAPAVAGDYYSDEPETLVATLDRYFGKVTPPPPTGRLRACIVPHAAYGFAGETMAHAFKELQPGQFERVIILAPSNFVALEDCSVPDVEGFLTPLGIVKVDRPALRTLTYSPQISLSVLHTGERARKEGLHEEEYAIEVLLPFLQRKLGDFKLVPILVGSFTRAGGGLNKTAMDNAVEQIRRVIDDKTLVVASSNLTQYGESFGYTPFKEGVFSKIENLDKVALEYLLKQDDEGFARYLELTQNPIVGRVAIRMAMALTPDSARGKLLDYDFSGRMMNSTERSVSYAAINYYETGEASAP